MIGFLSKIFGGNKSEKDIKSILPIVEEVNKYHFVSYSSLTNDELRAKTAEFKARIRAAHLGGMSIRRSPS